MTEVDLFVDSPLEDFPLAYARALHMEIAPGVEATVVGLEDLLALKRRAARPKDIEDIKRLQSLRDHDHD